MPVQRPPCGPRRESPDGAVAVYAAQGTSNATFADEAVKLDDPSWIVSLERIVDIAKRPRFALASTLSSPHPDNKMTSVGSAPETLRIAGTRYSPNLQQIYMRLSGVRYPVMIKALDGGGGRDIREASAHEVVEEALKRFMHGRDLVRLVSFREGRLDWNQSTSGSISSATTAPSTITRNLAQLLLAASTKMARAWRYQSTGTFACLVNSRSGEWVFLEIKPCVQIEHGVSIAGPAGRGVHADARLRRPGRDLGEATQQAVRALQETRVWKEEGGVETNRAVLAAVAADAHWEERKCDTMWLKRELKDVMRIGMEPLKPRVEGLGLQRQQGVEEVTVSSTSRSDIPPGLHFARIQSRRGHEEADTLKFSDPSSNSVARHDGSRADDEALRLLRATAETSIAGGNSTRWDINLLGYSMQIKLILLYNLI
ncbi:hypothetical protein FIBSPDRAFT_951348 [Athelia psychrophila]|uniref:Carbamoyl phosphate synthase ATP-binding domain-containing protein n=1 Tax=Athelia psychrophila TaxID=1759441 RepID=A0A166MTU9_9AGAM|nr:hypothetical protein FIBSPDRAFT_951348 [Fibularhizoctonia sp. CBS 109695]